LRPKNKIAHARREEKTPLGGEAVGGERAAFLFVTGGGEKEKHVPEEARSRPITGEEKVVLGGGGREESGTKKKVFQEEKPARRQLHQGKKGY